MTSNSLTLTLQRMSVNRPVLTVNGCRCGDDKPIPAIAKIIYHLKYFLNTIGNRKRKGLHHRNNENRNNLQCMMGR